MASASKKHRSSRAVELPTYTPKLKPTKICKQKFGPAQRPRAGWLYPGTNYVGPGNPIDNVLPTHELDAAAREHDINYGILQEIGIDPYYSNNPADSDFLYRLQHPSPTQDYSEAFGNALAQFWLQSKRLWATQLTEAQIENYQQRKSKRHPCT